MCGLLWSMATRIFYFLCRFPDSRPLKKERKPAILPEKVAQNFGNALVSFLASKRRIWSKPGVPPVPTAIAQSRKTSRWGQMK